MNRLGDNGRCKVIVIIVIGGNRRLVMTDLPFDILPAILSCDMKHYSFRPCFLLDIETENS